MVTHTQLRIFAAITWYSGGIVLALKATLLLGEAQMLAPESAAILWSVIAGLFIGTLKVRFIFLNSCRKNLHRIQQLDNPQWWQFYRPGFFLFLATMILLGSMLSRSAHGDFNWLIGIGTLDISLATALLGSSYLFWVSE